MMSCFTALRRPSCTSRFQVFSCLHIDRMLSDISAEYFFFLFPSERIKHAFFLKLLTISKWKAFLPLWGYGRYLTLFFKVLSMLWEYRSQKKVFYQKQTLVLEVILMKASNNVLEAYIFLSSAIFLLENCLNDFDYFCGIKLLHSYIKSFCSDNKSHCEAFSYIIT